MGLFSKFVSKKMGASKNDVKLAEIELKKQKLAAKENAKVKKKKKEEVLVDNAKASVLYANHNINMIKEYLDGVENTTRTQIEKIESLKNKELSRQEAHEIKRLKKSAEKNLKYLYLSKDFFSYCLKVAGGMELKKNEYIFIAQFVRYFDGVDVFSVQLEEDSIQAGMKSFFADFKQGLFGGEGEFSFDSFASLHMKEIGEYKMPNLNSVIESVATLSLESLCDDGDEEKEPIEEKEEESPEAEPVETNTNIEEGSFKCPNCGIVIDPNSKFCSNCGSKIEPKKKFCSECGAPLNPGAKFCSECGHKTN